MQKITLYVCGDDETLRDGTYVAAKGPDYTSLSSATCAACRLIDDSGKAISEVGHNFHDWHGGRFAQFYDRAGFVAYPKNSEAWVVELAEAASAAMQKEIEELDAKEEADDRAFWADTIEGDDEEGSETAGFFQYAAEILFPAAQTGHTRESLVAALRANDSSLLVEREEIEA